MLEHYPNILRAFTSSVWCMEPSVLNGWLSYLRGPSVSSGVPSNADELSVNNYNWRSDNTMVVPLFGAVGKYLSSMEIMCSGACDLSDFESRFDSAMADGSIENIVLHINSPGGTVTGVGEIASKIANSSKPVYAFTDSMMASAAYWIGASARAVYSTESSTVGSVGTYMAWVDPARNMEKEGFDLKLIKAGRLKAMHLPGQLSQEASDHEQKQVDHINGGFVSWVSEHRGGMIADDDMQGQAFMGSLAKESGYVDGIISGISELLEAINQTTEVQK